MHEVGDYVVPSFEIPEPGEGLQTRTTDFIEREFTNKRLFQELREGTYEKLAKK